MLHLAGSFFFSMSETAMISLGRSFLKKASHAETGQLKAIHDVLDNHQFFFGTVLIGNNIAIVGFSAFGVKLYENLNILYGWHLWGGLIIVTIVLDIVILAMGEIVPKLVGLSNSKAISLRIAPFLLWLSGIMKYPILLITWPSRMLFKDDKSEVFRPRIDDRAIRAAVDLGSEQETLGEVESEWISNVLELDDKIVSTIMTPAVNLVAVPHDATLREALTLAAQNGLSRLPVYREDIDHISGIVMVKELLALRNGDLDQKVLTFQHPVVKIPDTKCVFTLLKQMQARRRHMAIVVNEYGETAGIVTIEDIVEELVGEIYDEHDPPAPGINQTPEGKWLIDGLTERETIEETLELDLSEHDGIETIGGIVSHLYGELPMTGTVVEDFGFRFEVLKVVDNRVHLLEAEQLEVEPGDTDNGEPYPEEAHPS